MHLYTTTPMDFCIYAHVTISFPACLFQVTALHKNIARVEGKHMCTFIPVTQEKNEILH